jgi:hypothetical protein
MIMHARKAQQEPAAITKSTRARPHCLSDHEMSAFGPKRTSVVALHMSAFGGKADIELHWPSTAIMTLRAAACRLAISGW